MDASTVNGIFDRFKKLRVLVIGDVMIDAYLWGKVERISPEAPVPVVTIKKREQRLGGAANVARNLIALGAEALICSVAGKGERGNDLKALFEKNNLSTTGLVYSQNRKTSVKTRVISAAQHIVRVDDEDLHDLDGEEEKALLNKIAALMDNCDVIIFEDYNKGVLTENVIRRTIELAKEKGIPTCVDPKKKNFFNYKGVALFKPNLKELAEGLKVDLHKNDMPGIKKAVHELQQRSGSHCTLLTLSENGVFIKSAKGSSHLPAHVRNIADVSGAGDTVISVAALCLALGLEEEQIAFISNLAGGLVCEMVGVVPIDPERLRSELLLSR